MLISPENKEEENKLEDGKRIVASQLPVANPFFRLALGLRATPSIRRSPSFLVDDLSTPLSYEQACANISRVFSTAILEERIRLASRAPGVGILECLKWG